MTESRSSRHTDFGPTPRFVNPTLLRTRAPLDGEDQREQDTLEDYFADFQEMFSIGESHYTVAAGFISKKARQKIVIYPGVVSHYPIIIVYRRRS